MERTEPTRRARRVAWAALLAIAIAGSSGCSFLLPTSERRSSVPWEDFETALTAFDAIELERTGIESLALLGYDPKTSDVIQQLSYLETLRALVPPATVGTEDLPEGVRRCIAAQAGCRSYRAEVTVRNAERMGWLLLDILMFRRTTETRGWDFNATIVLVDERVVFKAWDGNPSFYQFTDKIRPLGPLQDPLAFIGLLFPSP